MAWSPPARKRRDLFGFQHPETTPLSIPTTPRTAPTWLSKASLTLWNLSKAEKYLAGLRPLFV
jgi:hypothetical protein